MYLHVFSVCSLCLAIMHEVCSCVRNHTGSDLPLQLIALELAHL